MACPINADAITAEIILDLSRQTIGLYFSKVCTYANEDGISSTLNGAVQRFTRSLETLPDMGQRDEIGKLFAEAFFGKPSITTFQKKFAQFQLHLLRFLMPVESEAIELNYVQTVLKAPIVAGGPMYLRFLARFAYSIGSLSWITHAITQARIDLGMMIEIQYQYQGFTMGAFHLVSNLVQPTVDRQVLETIEGTLPRCNDDWFKELPAELPTCTVNQIAIALTERVRII